MRLMFLVLVQQCWIGAWAATVSVHWQKPAQVIDGFGASSAWYADNVAALPEAKQDEIIRLLFDRQQGLGCSILRIRIPPDFYPVDQKAWQWQTPKLARQVAFIKRAKAAGVETILASPWSPPAWMKDSGTTKLSGRLLDKHYQDYADYLCRFVSDMQTRHNLHIDVLSMQNESDEVKKWECCLWTPAEQIRFISRHLGPTVAAAQLSVKIMAPELTMWDDHFKQWTKTLLADEPTAARLDIIAGHRYRKPPASAFPEVAAAGKRLWMSEYYWEGGGDLAIANAKTMHAFLTRAEVNAYLFWWMFAAAKKGEKQTFIRLHSETQTVSVTPQAYAFAQFSRHIRPGWRRLHTTASMLPKQLLISAFKSEKDDELAVVLINSAKTSLSVDLNLDGVQVSKLHAYRTSPSEQMLGLEARTPVSGRDVQITLPALSITTLVGAARGPEH